MFQYSPERMGNVDVMWNTHIIFSLPAFCPFSWDLPPTSRPTCTSCSISCIFLQSEIGFLLLSGTWYNSSISLPFSFLWSLSSLFFIRNTQGILPFYSPSMCQSCHLYSLCTYPSLSLEYSFPDLCMNALFCRHSDLPRPPKLKCLFCFLHSISYLLKLSYLFVLMFIFASPTSPPIKVGFKGQALPVHYRPECKSWPSPVWAPWTLLLNGKNHQQQSSFWSQWKKTCCLI